MYLYSNLHGCDGGRLLFDGSCLIAMNGKIYGQGPQFSLDEVDVTIGVMDLDEVRSARGGNNSRNVQSSLNESFPRVYADIEICRFTNLRLSDSVELRNYLVEEEIARGPALWLWDYLRRSGGRGFFLPLSGGGDSSAVACIVASLGMLLYDAIEKGNKGVLEDVRRVVKDPKFTPKSYKCIVG